MLNLITRAYIILHADRRGVTALEYALIAALMATVIVAVFGTFGGNVKAAFNKIGTHLTSGI